MPDSTEMIDVSSIHPGLTVVKHLPAGKPGDGSGKHGMEDWDRQRPLRRPARGFDAGMPVTCNDAPVLEGVSTLAGEESPATSGRPAPSGAIRE